MIENTKVPRPQSSLQACDKEASKWSDECNEQGDYKQMDLHLARCELDSTNHSTKVHLSEIALKQWPSFSLGCLYTAEIKCYIVWSLFDPLKAYEVLGSLNKLVTLRLMYLQRKSKRNMRQIQQQILL